MSNAIPFHLFRSKAEMARYAGVTRQAVAQWKQVPAEYCPAIERATSGRVRCEDLRPDVDWAVLRCDHDEKEVA